MTPNLPVDVSPQPAKKQQILVFAFLWLLTFIIYLPAAKAGWVIDSTGWLHNIRHLGFWDYINNKQSHIPSLYQFTQLTTYVFYRLFNANPYAWHTLMVSMHAVNAYLLYNLCRRLFEDTGIAGSSTIALTGALFFTICPHISEVIVWEASFHYLQGVMLILGILTLVQRYHYTAKIKYVLFAGFLFLCAAFSLEVFYLTPWFVLSLALYYRIVLGFETKVLKKVMFCFFIPQLAIFAVQLVLLRFEYGAHFAHIAENVVQPVASYFNKPPKYVFHILLFGRYFENGTREKIYQMCGSTGSMVVFYGLLLLLFQYIAMNIKTFTPKNKAAALLLVWMVISVVIIMPLAFPNIMLMFYDRYTYLLNAFTYMLLAVLVSQLGNKYIAYSLLGIYAIINLYFTFKVNFYWKHATYIDNRLMRELPAPGNKTVILLNIPENMNGIAMIGAQPDNEYKAMREMFVDSSLKNKIWDALSYNMLTPEDGANVTVKNDSVVGVTLNQWGTWWWYEGHGGRSYETIDYKINLIDAGHYYEITLKKPADSFMLLYSVGSIWKVVDMNKKDVKQD